jgi:hypothetical protein
MKPTYKVIEMPDYSYVERTDPNGKIWAIPMDEANSDYQAYLNKDKAEQSTPSVTNGD